MAEETIHEDVSETTQAQEQPENQHEEAQPELSTSDPVARREQQRQALLDKYKEQREHDRKAAALIQDPDLTEEEYDRRQEAAQEEDEPEGDEEQQPEAAETDEQPEGQEKPKDEGPIDLGNGWFEVDGKRVKRLKVNGRIVELTEEEYDRQVQKDLAGDERLRAASEKERELRELEQRLQRHYQHAQNQPNQQPAQQQPSQKSPEMGTEEVDKLIGQAAENLLDGDTEAYKATMARAMKAVRESSTPNMDELRSQLETQIMSSLEQKERTKEQERAAEEQRNEARAAFAEFSEAYPDLVGNDANLAYTDALVKQVEAEKPYLTFKEKILEAGRRASEALGAGQPATTEAPSNDTRETRRQRKAANVKPLPKAQGSAVNKTRQAPQVDMSPQAKIARMRAQRAAG